MHTKFFVFLSPSEDVVAGKESNSTLEWTSQLKEIINLQKALDTAKTITLPVPKDQLIINIDTFCQAIGATMFIRRGKTKLILEFFGPKLLKPQFNWTPCEIEALAIKCALKDFSPFIQESQCETNVL